MQAPSEDPNASEADTKTSAATVAQPAGKWINVRRRHFEASKQEPIYLEEKNKNGAMLERNALDKVIADLVGEIIFHF